MLDELGLAPGALRRHDDRPGGVGCGGRAEVSAHHGGWVQFWIVILNAVIGGLTVWARLSPYLVAAHFLAAVLFRTATTVVWHRVRVLDRPVRPLSVPVGRLPVALLAAVALLVVAGTLVTGTGPHAGDSSDVPRMPLNWTVMAWLHAAAAALALALWARTRREPRSTAHRRTTLFLAVFLTQCVFEKIVHVRRGGVTNGMDAVRVAGCPRIVTRRT
ncbi:hypothetical protein [Nonomuraea dietziae]|uniref:hypothetical protein n=1 Tax=Nonomuraea dietziae TaxID=65515 RepID=UPI0033CFE206